MIATHAPKKATHAPRESVVNIIRANFLVCIANSFEPIRKFCGSWVQVVSRRSPTRRSCKVSKVGSAFKDEIGTQHKLFPGGLLDIGMTAPFGMTRWPSATGNNPGVFTVFCDVENSRSESLSTWRVDHWPELQPRPFCRTKPASPGIQRK